MKKLFFSMFVAVVTLTLWSCGNTNTPSAVAEKAVKCIQKADYEGYVDLMNLKKTDEGNNEKEQLVALLREKGTKAMEKKQGLKSYEVLSEEISEDGKSATVKMKMVYGDGSEDTQDLKLVKNDHGKMTLPHDNASYMVSRNILLSE